MPTNCRLTFRQTVVLISAGAGGRVPDYIPRVVDDELDELMAGVAAIALEGPKGVGKTETALRRAATVYRLDDPGQQAILEADPSRMVQGPGPVLVDEWQRLAYSWDLVRRSVDDDPSPGRFLLTGSASPTAPATHSGAGRIVTVRMRPLSLAERGIGEPTVSLRTLLDGGRRPVSGRTDIRLEAYTEAILASGLPGLRTLDGRARRGQLDGYLQRIVERDFDELGHRVRNPIALRRWMTAYAAATSTTASFEKIREAASGGQGETPARSTTYPYRDLLEQLWILEPVLAWLPTRSPLRRLGGSPKHQLADPALAARLLRVGKEALLSGHDAVPTVPRDGTLLGALFESLVTLCVRVYAQHSEATVGHLRTKGGEHEVDLVVESDDRRVLAIEVKLAQAVDDSDVRHLRWLSAQLGEDLLDAVVITTGPEAYRRRDGVAVIPAALLGP